MANLVKNHEKNHLHYAIRSIDINELRILGSYIYSDINKSRYNLYLKLISTIYNLSDDNVVEGYNNKPMLVINYNLYAYGKPVRILKN